MSNPSLSIPSLPSDFESRAGSSKTELARAILELLAGASIQNYPTSAEDQFDLANFQQRLEDLEQNFEDAIKPIRRVRLNGIGNGTHIFSFEDVGDTNYGVATCFWKTGTGSDEITWFFDNAAKTSSEVTLVLEDLTGTIDVEVLIIPYAP